MSKNENKRNYEQKTRINEELCFIFGEFSFITHWWWAHDELNTRWIQMRTQFPVTEWLLQSHFTLLCRDIWLFRIFHFNYYAYEDGVFLHSSLTPWHCLEGVRWELWLRSAHDAYIIQLDTPKHSISMMRCWETGRELREDV